MGTAPRIHAFQYGLQGLAVFGHGILHPRRYFGVDFAVDEAVRFQFPQLLGEHFLGNALNVPAEFVEAHGRTLAKQKQNQWFPFAADNFKGYVNGRALGSFTSGFGHNMLNYLYLLFI
jgi:hypothetical protein